MREIFCHNQAHLGDCIQSLHFFIKASKINEVKFKFNCDRNYFGQFKNLIKGYNIELIDEKSRDSIETWVDGHKKYHEYQKQSDLPNGKKDQSKTFLLHWIDISKIMNIECPFKEKNDLIYDEDVLGENCIHNEKYDYLIINSKPLSGQFSRYCESEFKKLVENILKENKTVITTQKIENIPCTNDCGLDVVEIGKLSKNVKNIMAVNTGPLHLCLNKWTIDKVNFTIFANGNGGGCSSETFDFGPNFQTKSSII